MQEDLCMERYHHLPFSIKVAMESMCFLNGWWVGWFIIWVLDYLLPFQRELAWPTYLRSFPRYCITSSSFIFFIILTWNNFTYILSAFFISLPLTEKRHLCLTHHFIFYVTTIS
jgi:hypothetical protein